MAVLGTNLFFAANFTMVKMISPSLIGAFGLNVYRAGLSVLLFWGVWLLGKTPAKIEKRHWGRFALCGLFGVAINQMMFLKGLTLTSTVHASLLTLTTPLLITLFALWVLKERLTLVKALGLVLGIGGSALLILARESSAHAADYLLGDGLIVLNAAFYAFYFILVKPLMEHYSPLHVIRWVFTLGFFMILPFGWSQAVAVDFGAFRVQHFVALGWVVVMGTFLAYYFNTYGIRHLGAGTTGAYIYTQPVFAVVIAALVLGEELSWQKALAACLIFSGVYLANQGKTKAARHKDQGTSRHA
jgi:drug/metabolite transporter (DMT)-like permease